MNRIKLSILGSTGSIGQQALEVVRENPDHFQILSLAAGRNINLLKAQIEEFKPEYVSVQDEDTANILRQQLSKHPDLSNKCLIESGADSLSTAATLAETEIVLLAVLGYAALSPLLAALSAGKKVGLANKESLVAGGGLVMDCLRQAQFKNSRAELIPIDSEHSSVFQCLQSRRSLSLDRLEQPRKIIITASGGPFLKRPLETMHSISPEEAVKHPNWSMGAKISVDSATMMNKGLEVIEASFLFKLPAEKIEVLIHPQSLVHGMAEYQDGTVMAALSNPNMKLPIAFALDYLSAAGRNEAKNRIRSGVPFLDLGKSQKLEFFTVDNDRFPALEMCYSALSAGGSLPTVLNAANEVAVNAFLERKIKFTAISRIVEETLTRHDNGKINSIEDVVWADAWARESASNIIVGLEAKAAL